MPTDDWLCRKLNKLNLTLVEGYPSQSSEASGLLKDQFLRPAKSQAKWHRLYSDHKGNSTAVLSWNTDASRLNSSYSRIARQAGLASNHRPHAISFKIQEQSRKYLRFHIQGQTYQFKALSFGLSTAPMKFSVVAKEVKQMAIHKGIRIHQYLDDWLVRESQIPPSLSPAYSGISRDLSETRLAS